MNLLQLLSTVLGLVLFLPLAWQIVTKRVTQNIATFILWGLLDGIAAASTLVQGGNWYLPAAYTCGSVLIIACLLSARSFTWTAFETYIAIMVAFCVIGWMVSGPWLATVLSSVGMALAGLPQIKDAFKIPEQAPTLVYVGYTTANVLATAGGKAWTAEERLYPALAAVVCVFIVIGSLGLGRNRVLEPEG